MTQQNLEVILQIRLGRFLQLQEHRRKLAPKLLGILLQFGLQHRKERGIQQHIQPYHLKLL